MPDPFFFFKSRSARSGATRPPPPERNEPALKCSEERTKRKGLRPRLTACGQKERTTGGRFHSEGSGRGERFPCEERAGRVEHRGPATAAEQPAPERRHDTCQREPRDRARGVPQRCLFSDLGASFLATALDVLELRHFVSTFLWQIFFKAA